MTPCPTDNKWKTLLFEIHPKGYREKFRAVPRNVQDETEDLISITRFMKMCWDSEQKTGKRVSDNQPLKRGNKGQGEDEKVPALVKRTKGNKTKDSNKTKGDERCVSPPWLQGCPPALVEELLAQRELQEPSP